jgi:WhiB family redox-sensing transcriptional regulator
VPWLTFAKCRGLPADWWYPPSPITTEATVRLRKAKALCDECPVQSECLEAGMDEEHGIWGGLGPKQRRKLRKGAA